MFNGYNETPLIPCNEFNQEREKKIDSVPKWPYGQDAVNQPTPHSHSGHRGSEFWSGKPNFLGIPKCNCSGCYPSSENQSYQNDSTRHRPWLPRSFPVPLNGSNEPCKLPGYQWDNVNLANQGSCYQEGNITNYSVQDTVGKHSYYRHYSNPNPRLPEANQPGVITSVKNSDLTKKAKEDVTPSQEMIFHGQNGTRQTVFCNPAYNLSKRLDSRSSSYCDSNEKYSNVDSYRHSVNSYPANSHVSRLPVVEPYMKAVPSNQNRVPSTGHRSIKENMVQSYSEQDFNDPRKCSERAMHFGDKSIRTMHQAGMNKEITDNYQLQMGIDFKNAGVVDHRPYNMPVPCGNMFKPESQKMLFDNSRQVDLYSRNNTSDIIKRNNPVIDSRKDCLIGQMPEQLPRMILSNAKPGSGMFYSKEFNVENPPRPGKFDQENSSCFQRNDDFLRKDNIRLPRSSLIFNDPHSQNSFPHTNNPPSYRNYLRSDYPPQGYNAQGRLDYPPVSHEGFQNQYNQRNVQQPLTSCSVADQFVSQSNNSFIYNSHYQQSEDKIVHPYFYSNKNQSPAPQAIPEESRVLEVGKINYLETIQSEEVNKPNTSKISPLRLLRKKKFINPNSESIAEPAPVSSVSDATSTLDVRKFWSTWAEEEEESVPPTQMVVLDCQNIDLEQAKLLQLYESDPVKTVHLESGSIITLKEPESEQYQPTPEEVKPNLESDEVNKEKLMQQEMPKPTENLQSSVISDSEAAVNEQSVPRLVIMESTNQKNTNETKPCKRGRLSAFQDNKESTRHKKTIADKKPEEIGRLDKWTEKKFDFLKRSEESKAAEILRHEEEKKKIFERRLSLQQGNPDGVKPKFNSKAASEEDEDEKIASSIIDDNSQSESPFNCSGSDLPTSEYRRNKFLDYSDRKVIVSSGQEESDIDIHQKVVGSVTLTKPKDEEIKQEDTKQECLAKSNWSLAPDKTDLNSPFLNAAKLKEETGLENTEMDDIMKKMSEIHFQNAEVKAVDVKKTKVSSGRKTKKLKKLGIEEESDERGNDKLTVENISTSKPTIKFSIQKSHDLKISFKVLNSSGKEEGGREETENQIKPNDNINSTELITLKLKSIQNNDLKENKRLFRKKKIKGRLNQKTPVVKIKKRRDVAPEEEKDPLAPDADHEKCLNLSKKNYPDGFSDDFHVQETVDSAKIKLTFKRHKSNYETECKINQVFKDPDTHFLDGRPKKKSTKGIKNELFAETGAESCKSEPENTDSKSDIDSDLETLSKKKLEEDFQNFQMYEEEENYELRPLPFVSPDHLAQATSPVYLISDKLDTSSLETQFCVGPDNDDVEKNEENCVLRDDIIHTNCNEEFLNECSDGPEGYALIFGDGQDENKNNDFSVQKEVELESKENCSERASEVDIKEKKENQIENPDEIFLDFNRNVNVKASKTDENFSNRQTSPNMEVLSVDYKSPEINYERQIWIEKKDDVGNVDFEKPRESDLSTNETNHSENIESSYYSKSDEAKLAVEETKKFESTFEVLSQEINILDTSKESETRVKNQIVENLMSCKQDISIEEPHCIMKESNPSPIMFDENKENQETPTVIEVSDSSETSKTKEENEKQTDLCTEIQDGDLECSASEAGILENDTENISGENIEILSDILDPEDSEFELPSADDPVLVESISLSKKTQVADNLKTTQEDISHQEKVENMAKEEDSNEIVNINTNRSTVDADKQSETELEEGEIVDDSSNDESLCFHNTESLEKTLVLPKSKENNNQKEECRDSPSKKFRFLQEISVDCRKIIHRRHSVTSKNVESPDENSFFKFSYQKSCFTKAKSCPPRLTFFEEIMIPVLDVPVEDIPLPPGDPLPENCFDFEKYFSEKNSTEASCANKIKSKEDPVLKITAHSPQENISFSSSLNSNKSLPLVTEDLTKKNESNSEFPLHKNYKIKFSLMKRKNPLPFFSKNEVHLRHRLPKTTKKTEKQNTLENKKKLSEDFEKVESGISSSPTEIKSSGADEEHVTEKLNELTSPVSELNSPKNNDSYCKSENQTKRQTKITEESMAEEICKVPEIGSSEEIIKPSEESETDLRAGFQVDTMPEQKVETVAADQLKTLEVMDDETISVLNLDSNTSLRSEFYKCEGIPTSESVQNEDDDIEVEKVSDDDKFRNIMQNCLDNAKKFLNVGNLKLFSCSVDDLLELHCPDSNLEEIEPSPDSANHISKDVLLTSCEDTAADDLGLSEKFQPSDMSMDFVPSFSSEGPNNLCPEILPVDNWPYLEEEVPSSPTKLKPEDTDLISSLDNMENDNSYKDLNSERIDKMSKNKKIVCSGETASRKFRRKSLMGDSSEKLSKFTPQRRKTIDTFSVNVLPLKKSSGRLLQEIKKLKNDLENLWQNNNSLKCRLSLKKLTNGKKVVPSDKEEDTGSDSSGVFEPTNYTAKRRLMFDFKSPTWQPKVMLFRISKGELKRVCKNSRIKDWSEKKEIIEELNEPKMESSEPHLKKQKSCDLIYVKSEREAVSKDESEKLGFSAERYFPKDESDVDSFKGSISAPEVRKRKKSRFRNLHTKRKSESEITRVAKDIEFAQNSMPSASTPVEAEDVLSKWLTDCNEPKERVISSNAKSTNEEKVKEKSGDDSKRKKFKSPSYGTNSSNSLGDKNRLVKEDEKSRSHNKLYKHGKHQRNKHEHRKGDSRSHKDRHKNRKEGSRHRDERGDKSLDKMKNESSKNIQKKLNLTEEEGSSDNSWVCEVCGFSDINERISHIKSHPFHCQSCHLAFKTEAFFVNHLTKKHKDIRNQHHCLLCELSFDTEEQYQRHLDTREHRHLESVEKNTINTLFTLLTGQPCPVLGFVEMKPEWLPNQAGTVHFYHQATPLSLALQYLKMHQDLTSYSISSAHPN